jgi:hypothetical protein
MPRISLRGTLQHNLVDGVFLQHGPWHPFWGLEDFFQHRCLTRVFKDWIEGVSDEIEKRLQVCIAEFFGGLFCAVGEID